MYLNSLWSPHPKNPFFGRNLLIMTLIINTTLKYVIKTYLDILFRYFGKKATDKISSELFK